MLLELSGIEAGYGSIKVLHGVSLEIHEGEIVTLIGNNGAGKTTTLMAISGMLKPRGGEIVFDGRPITGLAPDRIVELGICQVPEGRGVFPSLTVKENLELAAMVVGTRPDSSKAFDRVYDLFPVLKERENQRAGTLSGGEQKMLAIGKGLISRPKLLLLDEPSLGLAPMLVQNLFKVIEQINQMGTSILLVEQNAYQALAIADRGYVMELGKICAYGPAEKLLSDDTVRKAYLGC